MAVVSPPGGAPPVANVHVIVRYVNTTVRSQGRAGAQNTGAVVLIRRVNYPSRPVAGTLVETAAAALTTKTVERTTAWWKCEATRA